jgi:hypothetical protein
MTIAALDGAVELGPLCRQNEEVELLVAAGPLEVGPSDVGHLLDFGSKFAYEIRNVTSGGSFPWPCPFAFFWRRLASTAMIAV